MKTIYKYELHPSDTGFGVFPVEMPEFAEYLYVAEQNNKMFLFAEVDTERNIIQHRFEVFGTGHEMPVDMGVYREYIGSLMMHTGTLVFHVYHRIN